MFTRVWPCCRQACSLEHIRLPSSHTLSTDKRSALLDAMSATGARKINAALYCVICAEVCLAGCIPVVGSYYKPNGSGKESDLSGGCSMQIAKSMVFALD